MSKTVLLVDDAAMFLEILKDYLRMSNLKIVTARDGAEAYTAVQSLRPDLIVMDLHMPRMNGAECCTAIKADLNLRKIPIIIATSATNTADHDLCRRAGCDGLLTKPFERGLFLSTIRQYVPELDRREPRIPLVTKIRFQAYRVTMSGLVQNLSARGVYVASEFALDVGTEVMLSFSLEEGSAVLIQGKGIVRWSNGENTKNTKDLPPGFGLEFSALTTEARAALQRFMLIHAS
jgi:uncharacterized protein (TIGR02266 family)